jgi:beta-glucosidase-like glycosyl hydrolase/CubicO group peptidase (beta-lactamase class C family)
MKKGLFLVLGCVCLFALPAQTPPRLYRAVDGEKMNHWADSVFDAMSMDERIGQLFMVMANPKTDQRNMQQLQRYIDEVKIGGVLFHKGDPATQAEVTNRIQKASRVPLFIALDGEWGLSMRLSGTTRFPRNMILGAIENDTLIRRYGEEVGRQCREMGIHINFAPILDVNSNTDNPVIGTRSFGENPQAVADKGIAYSKGLESTGVFSVAKHFPGHGDTSEDSHHTLPVIRHTMERLDSVELFPFKRYIDEGFAGIMTAHLYVTALDGTKDKPASLSHPVVTTLLQEKLGFGGLLFTDALAMKGATAKKTDNPSVLALLAGNDILLAPASPVADFAAVKQAIDEGVLGLKTIEEKCLKILRYKYIAGLNAYKPVQTKGLTERLNSPHAAWLAAKLNAEAATVLKNESNYLPVKGLDKKKIALLSIGEATGNAFQAMVNRYDSAACFAIERNATAAQVQKVYGQLEQFDLIICSVHTVRIPESGELRRLAEKKELVMAFFTLPYFCKEYKRSMDKARSVVMGYEATPLAEEYAAQVIFGGIPAKGKLPVTIPGLYYAGTGIFTEKTRLGYHRPEEVGMDAAVLDTIDRIIAGALKEKAFPGCQALVARKGMILYHKAFGYYDDKGKQKVTENAVYDLASVTKAAGTLLAVMHLYDEKAFTLDSKISAYVPFLKESDKKELTIKELLYHQSGAAPIISFHTKSYFPGLVASKAGDADFPIEAARGFYLHTSFKDTVMKEIRESRLTARGKYVYSCLNFIMLQKMVENRMKQPLDTVLGSLFYDRLGAHTTTFNPLRKIDTLQIVPTENDRLIRHQLLRGYVHDEMAAFQGGVSGNAGLFSNANDLAKVLQLFLNHGSYGGERYLSEETVRLFTESKSPVSRRGLGFDKPDTANGRKSPCGELAPPSVYGHTGFTGTCFWVDPDNQLIYIFLSNRVHPSRTNNKLSSLEVRTRIQDALYKAIEVLK